MRKTFLLIFLSLFTTQLHAQYSRGWSETSPADTDLANTIGVAVRNLRTDIRQRLSDSITDFSNGNLVFQSQIAGTPSLVLLPALTATSGGHPLEIKNTSSVLVSFFDINGNFNVNGATSGTVTIVAPAVAGTTTITLPSTTGTIATTANVATVTLNNLTTTSINADLLPSSAGSRNLGNSSLPFITLYFSGSSLTPATNNFTITGAATAARTWTFQDASDTLVGKATTDVFTNKTLDTAGVGNVLKINGVQVSAVTGSGSVVLSTSPTLVTPVLGLATATTINKVTITSPATGSTVTIADGKTLAVNNSLTLAGTDGTTLTFQGTDTYVGRSTTDTLNNKTISCSSASGNTCTIATKIYLDAAGCNNATATGFWDLPTSAAAVANCITGTNTQKAVLDFSTTGTPNAQIKFLLPGDMTSTMDARIIWLSATISGNVIWNLATVCTAVNSTATDDPAFNSASTVTTAAPSTANQLATSSITGITITGCTAGTFMHVKISRTFGGSDTLNGTVRLMGVELTMRRAINF